MKLKLLGIVLFWQILQNAPISFGQVCNIGRGAFSVTPAAGCVGETVRVKNEMVGAETVRFYYDFDRSIAIPPHPDSGLIESTPYIYTKPGTYVILQSASLGSDLATLCKDYKVRETGRVTVTVLACANGKAQLILANDSVSQAYDKIEVNWGDGEKEVWTTGKNLTIPHVYKSGPKSVIVTGMYNDASCQSAIKPVTFVPTLTTGTLIDTKIMSVEMQANGTVRILYEGSATSPTKILMDEGSGTFRDTGKGGNISGTQSATVEGLDPKKVYRFKLSSQNICEDEVLSPIVSSVVLEDAGLALDEINSLSWKAYPDAAQLIQYQLKRDDVVITSTTSLSYLDKTVKCGNTYKYELVAILQNDGRSYSVPVSIEPKSSAPETITEASVTVNDNGAVEANVAIGGQGLTSTYDLVIERTPAGSASWSQISPPNHQSLRYTDSDANTATTSYCYRFKYVNACKLSSPDFSKPVCSILLTRNVKDVSWTTAAPFTDAVREYEVLMTDRAGVSVGNETVGLNNAYDVDVNDQNVNAFRIEARSASGMKSFSNFVSFQRDPIVLAPDAFTPNGDGHNERFEIKSYFAETFRLSVFNRWGEVVFRTETANDGWDGYYKGNPAPGGYYFYKVEVTDIQGKKINREGSFLLIR